MTATIKIECVDDKDFITHLKELIKQLEFNPLLKDFDFESGKLTYLSDGEVLELKISNG